MRSAVEETESAGTLAYSKTWPRCQIYIRALAFWSATVLRRFSIKRSAGLLKNATRAA
jgi:hypothetical protein